eukprot:Gb_21455 [translate_table: standard]
MLGSGGPFDDEERCWSLKKCSHFWSCRSVVESILNCLSDYGRSVQKAAQALMSRGKVVIRGGWWGTPGRERSPQASVQATGWADSSDGSVWWMMNNAIRSYGHTLCLTAMSADRDFRNTATEIIDCSVFLRTVAKVACHEGVAWMFSQINVKLQL